MRFVKTIIFGLIAWAVLGFLFSFVWGAGHQYSDILILALLPVGLWVGWRLSQRF